MKKTIQISLASVALLSQLQADKAITLEPLTVTSTAIQTDELKAADAVEVYTQEDIQKAHVQNVYEFLNQHTSVITMPSYGNPFTQKLDFHGYGIGDGYQNIVVTINGRKINNIDMVAPLLSSVSPSSIERIEIIKSSGIVTGGDGANAGVINIKTKKSNEKELSFYAGTYNTFAGSFYLGHSDENLSVSASGEAQKSGGIRHVDNDGNKDASRLSTGTFDLSYKASKELELRLGASFSKADIIYGSYLSQDQYEEDTTQKSSSYYSATHQLYDTNTLSGGLSYYINDEFSIKIDANHEKKRSQYITYSSISDYEYNSAKSTLDYENQGISVSAGIDIFEGTRDSHANFYAIANETTKKNLAGFIMSRFNFAKHSLKAGYRYERVAYAFSDAFTSNKEEKVLHGAELGYNYTFDKENSVFVNYAHSYQAPDIDRFFSYGSFNGFINPMQANSLTLGYNSITNTNKLKISAYYIDLQDEIYYYNDLVNSWPAPSLSVNTNIDKSRKYGIDVYDKYLISGMWNLALNYNYVQAIIDEETGRNNEDYSGNKLPGVSEHNAKATLSYLPSPHATIALTQIYRSQAYAINDFDNDLNQKQDPYKSTDISVTYAKDNYEVFAKINNLFNQKNGLWIKDDTIYPVNFTTTAMAGFKLKY
ncbi:TonB-dependent receptor [bacterium]|nr:TonB-dependent receptor [bacterium]